MFFETTSIVSLSSAVGDLDIAVGGVVHELPLDHVAQCGDWH
jgi:hypothetical protein